MLLYLLRHANADTEAATDDARALSEKGRSQAEQVGRFCEAHEMHLSVVLTSPVRRAHETAVIVAEKMRAEWLVVPWLACGMHPEAALEELRAYRSHGSVMRKASLTLIDLGFFRAGAGCLQFSLPCKLM